MVGFVAFCFLVFGCIKNVKDNKNCGAYHLDSVIFHPELLDDAFNDFQYLDEKTYGVHHPDSVVGYPESLHQALDAVRHLQAKNYRAHHLGSVMSYP